MRKQQLKIAIAALLAVTAFAPIWVYASSHSEAPGTAKDRLADDTDTYAFVSPDRSKTVTLIGNWVPLEEPSGGPNFYSFDDDAFYYINVDNVGDAEDHITWEFKFTTHVRNGNTFLLNTGPIRHLTDQTFNVYQTYTVTRFDNGTPTVLGTDLPVPPNNIGPKSTPDYDDLAEEAVKTLSDGSKVFAGQRDDPFFVDLGSVFDLLTIRKLPGNRGGGVDGVGGFNVLQIALQVPVERLTKNGGPVDNTNNIIGVYTSVHRNSVRTINADGTVSLSGSLVSVSRLGHPLINEVVIARKDKDKFNASEPKDDAQFLSYVQHPEAAGLLHALFGLSVPPEPRNDLVTVFLTGIPGLNQPANVKPAELLRVNMSIKPTRRPNRLGVLGGDVQGFPNGRRLADDVVDIELRALAGGYVLTPTFNHSPNNQLGDGVDFNDRPYLSHFPYEGLPHSGFSHKHHRTQQGQLRRRDDLVGGAQDEQALDEAYDNPGSALDADDDDSGAVADARSIKVMGANPGQSSDLQYTINNDARVTLKIYDLQGRVVRELIDQDAAAGTFRTHWDGRNEEGRFANSGVYFARFTVNGKTVGSTKLVLQ